MGLLSGVGPALKGLFATHDFGDSLSQARAVLDGDYGTGIDVAARRSRRHKAGSAIDALKKDGTGSLRDARPDDGSPLSIPPVGAIVDGHRFLGGDPNQDSSWQPLGSGIAAANGPAPADFGTWY